MKGSEGHLEGIRSLVFVKGSEGHLEGVRSLVFVKGSEGHLEVVRSLVFVKGSEGHLEGVRLRHIDGRAMQLELRTHLHKPVTSCSCVGGEWCLGDAV